jgi:hypothetical protein
MSYYQFTDGTCIPCADFDARSELIILDVARCTTGAPIWLSYWYDRENKRHHGSGWQLFTGFGLTFDDVRSMRWRKPQ